MSQGRKKSNDSISVLEGIELLSTSKTSTPFVQKNKNSKRNSMGICSPMVLRSVTKTKKIETITLEPPTPKPVVKKPVKPQKPIQTITLDDTEDQSIMIIDETPKSDNIQKTRQKRPNLCKIKTQLKASHSRLMNPHQKRGVKHITKFRQNERHGIARNAYEEQRRKKNKSFQKRSKINKNTTSLVKSGNDNIFDPESAANYQFSNLPSSQKHVCRFGQKRRLRPIVIDGQNVAVQVGKKDKSNPFDFSSKAIKNCVDYFLMRGHNDVIAFLPKYRMKVSYCDDVNILRKLEKDGHLEFTPCRKVGNENISSYDDRYVVQLAANNGGVIVSNDQFRDLIDEDPLFREAIEQRLLPFNYVWDSFIFPQDPLGKNGPKLDKFLSF